MSKSSVCRRKVRGLWLLITSGGQDRRELWAY